MAGTSLSPQSSYIVVNDCKLDPNFFLTTNNFVQLNQ